MRFQTQVLHTIPDKITGATNTPIYQTSAYAVDTAEDMANIFMGRKPGYIYTRVGNPTLSAFESRVTVLENGVGAVSFSSGMAAIAMSVMNVLSAGDEIVSASGIFGGTNSLFRELATYGVTTRFAKSSDAADFAESITDKTKLIYAETIGNPKLDVADIKVLADLAHSRNIPLFVDSTVTTPFMIRPLELGADVVIHSASKALNGNGNSIGGIVVTGKSAVWNPDKFPKLNEFEKFGPFMYLARLRARMATDFGSSLSPFNAYLTGVGLDTLALRMERATDNALALAKYLSNNEKVKVSYPGLVSHPNHELAKRQFQGRYGLMLTLKLGNIENAFKFIDGLKLALNVSNIGDARTLVIHPHSTIFLHASDAEKAASGVTEDLVRVAVGIEDIEDLKEDFEQSLAKL